MISHTFMILCCYNCCSNNFNNKNNINMLQWYSWWRLGALWGSPSLRAANVSLTALQRVVTYDPLSDPPRGLAYNCQPSVGPQGHFHDSRCPHPKKKHQPQSRNPQEKMQNSRKNTYWLLRAGPRRVATSPGRRASLRAEWRVICCLFSNYVMLGKFSNFELPFLLNDIRIWPSIPL